MCSAGLTPDIPVPVPMSPLLHNLWELGGAQLRSAVTALSLMPVAVPTGDAVAPGSPGCALLWLRQRLLARQSETPLQVTGRGTGHCPCCCRDTAPASGLPGNRAAPAAHFTLAGRELKATAGVCSTPAKTDPTFLSSNWTWRQFRFIQNRALSS